MAAVLDVEAAVGHIARDMNDEHRNHPGYDVQSLVPASGDRTDRLLFIEVKGRIEASETVTVSRNEILTALNAPDQFVLALVEVSRSGQRHDRVRYLSRPFEGIGVTHFAETSRNFAWTKLWELGTDPREHFAGDAGTDDDLGMRSDSARKDPWEGS